MYQEVFRGISYSNFLTLPSLPFAVHSDRFPMSTEKAAEALAILAKFNVDKKGQAQRIFPEIPSKSILLTYQADWLDTFYFAPRNVYVLLVKRLSSGIFGGKLAVTDVRVHKNKFELSKYHF